jgi:hypothetical protein
MNAALAAVAASGAAVIVTYPPRLGRYRLGNPRSRRHRLATTPSMPEDSARSPTDSAAAKASSYVRPSR